MAKDPQAAPGNVDADAAKLAEIRTQIDATDDELLRLLNRRAAFVATVADLKSALQVPFYVPSRERQIADRLSAPDRR